MTCYILIILILTAWSIKFSHQNFELNKANLSDTEAPFLDFYLTISDGFISSSIYDKRDDFDFDVVNLPFIDCDIPRATSDGVYTPVSQLIRFARVSNHVPDFNTRNKNLRGLFGKFVEFGHKTFKYRYTAFIF